MTMIFTEYSLSTLDKLKLIPVAETEVSYVGYYIVMLV